MQIIHHGAKDGVTGSCHELVIESDYSILIDCGLFQGAEQRQLDIDFDLSRVKALVVTHCHIDHVGRIPWLLAAGFRGEIYLTQASAALLPIVLEDGIKVHFGSNRLFEAVETLLDKSMVAVAYDQWLQPCDNVNYRLRFQPAGHILGSAFVEVDMPDGTRGVFSGDLGPCNTPLLPDPVPPEFADWLVMESTYGQKVHDDISQRRFRLKTIIKRSLRDGGVILVPAFSIGRTQELLFDIEQLIHELADDPIHQIPVILDSPIAQKFTDNYRNFKKFWSLEAKQKLQSGRHPLNFEQLVCIDSHSDHKALVNRLSKSAEPCIVIAASGMVSGGRIVNYMKALLPDKRTDVLLVGYQAKGTPGRALFKDDAFIRFGEDTVKNNAQVHNLGGYSAHADKDELINFIMKIKGLSKVRVVHGEPKSQHKFKENLLKANAELVVEAACDI
ncbi:MBL fold hydrolase [Shewanella sp. OPT22]|nr:MBL fold hydrolase [Shewanella sp. OPT22]